MQEIIKKQMEELYSVLEQLPREVADVIEGIQHDVVEGSTKGKCSSHFSEMLSEYVNVIPSNYKASCTPTLITICYDGDNFNNRVMQSLKHASIDCYGTCKNIYFITTKWESVTINQLMGYIESVRENKLQLTSFI